MSDVSPCIMHALSLLGICAHMQQSFRLKTCSPFPMPFALQNFACTLSCYVTLWSLEEVTCLPAMQEKHWQQCDVFWWVQDGQQRRLLRLLCGGALRARLWADCD